MILLRGHGLLFIKGSKVAGTSVEVFLSAHAGEQDIVTPIIPPAPLHHPRNYLGPDGAERFYNHIDAVRVKELLGEEYFAGLRRFGIVRNPFEKVRSMFAMQYVRNAGDYDIDRAIADTWSEAQKYCDASGACLLTDVLKYESLDEQLKALLVEAGIPFERLSIREKSAYRKACPVEPELADHHRERIVERFSWEFANYYPRELEEHSAKRRASGH